jgi:hypothetical protein
MAQVSLYVRTYGAGRGTWGGQGECEAGWIRPPRLGAVAMMRSPTLILRAAPTPTPTPT